MKKLSTSMALLGAIVVLGASPVFGQQFNFDEFGNGAFGPGVLQADPTGGFVGGPVMVYPLPFAGTPGDVLLHDGALANPFLDVIRFTGNGQLIFYSDNTDGFDAPADTAGPPNPLFPNQVNLVEPQNEGGLEQVFYTPVPGQPGFDPTLPPGSTYDFISDVPEPSSAVLLLAGLGVLGFWRTRQKRAASSS
jgi:PEP-CTERM motif